MSESMKTMKNNLNRWKSANSGGAISVSVSHQCQISNSGSQTSMVSAASGTAASSIAAPRARLLRSRASTPLTPLSAPDSPARRRAMLNAAVGGASGGYDSDGGGDSLRLDRAAHQAVKQDILGVKAMLVKLKRVLNESETHNPLDSQTILSNGIFSSPYPDTASNCDSLHESDDSGTKAKFEMAELRKQVLFLQGQIEDRETTIQSMQEQMIKLSNENYHANSAPASVTADCQMCNAATQTERIRPISAGPSLLNGSPIDGTAASLVSASDSSPVRRGAHRQSYHHRHRQAKAATPTTPQLWRRPGEPPAPTQHHQQTSSTSSPSRRHGSSPSSIPRRARSRSKTTHVVPMPATSS
ncbi:unnamed protein product [Acanthoscelides obtectus]|uniref:Uncharacterized protein n=1 Tax=Acanthoscelides obtectus TaxID=200917 RepID=A0A9P0MA55_ACAOB|nr:unnamed protein product [Acanthoscelides obtectus]CAK1664112.1 hypothetical protein AOBTE_LOCUS24060 [Acanthoscelides obtectus]